MAKIDPRAVLKSAATYVREHPTVLRRVAINAAAMKVTVPLDVLRYFVAKNAGSKKAPKDVVLETRAPALRVAATVSLMGTSIRFGASIEIAHVGLSTEEIRIALRLSDVMLRVEGESDSPVAALIKSGALDLSKPGNLARYMPNRPAMLVEAEDDRIVLDLMKNPKIAENPRVKRVLAMVTPVLGIRSVRADDDLVAIALQPKPAGVPVLAKKIKDKIASAF